MACVPVGVPVVKDTRWACACSHTDSLDEIYAAAWRVPLHTESYGMVAVWQAPAVDILHVEIELDFQSLIKTLIP